MSVNVREWKKGSGGWEIDIRFRWPDGSTYRERVRSPVPSKSASQRWGADREAHLIRQGNVSLQPKKEVPKLADFVPRFVDGHLRANRKKASTVSTYERIFKKHVLPRFGQKRLDEIQTQAIQLFKSDLLANDLDAKTVNNILSPLSKLLKVAVDWELLDRLPCRITMLPATSREMEFYEYGDYARLVEGAQKVEPRVHLAVLLGGDAGLRRGEITALRTFDVDLRRRQITVQRAEWEGIEDDTKGRGSRVVPMTKALYEALLRGRHLRGDRVLSTDDGEPIDANAMEKWMRLATTRAGLAPSGGFHILRHTFCSHLALRGAPAKAIQELAGHKQLSTTFRYMHLSPAHRQQAIALLDERPSGGWLEGLGDIVETAPAANENTG
jgi:integrase